jgi:maltooligosyltrehalose synthase
MKVAFELEFPDEQAADAFRWLQNLPTGWAARWKQRKSKKAIVAPERSSQPKLSEADQNRLLNEFAGSWQSDEDGTELARQIRESRHFRDRDVEL